MQGGSSNKRRGCAIIHDYESNFLTQEVNKCLHTCINKDHSQVDTVHPSATDFAVWLLSWILPSLSPPPLDENWVTFLFCLVCDSPWLPRYFCPSPQPPSDQFIVLRPGSWSLVHIGFLSRRVWWPFWSSDSSQTKATDGKGLVLYLWSGFILHPCRRICKHTIMFKYAWKHRFFFLLIFSHCSCEPGELVLLT